MATKAAIRVNEVYETPTDLGGDAIVEISGELRKLLADVFALYLKTKNFRVYRHECG